MAVGDVNSTERGSGAVTRDAGNLVIGTLSGKPVVMMQGRFHTYEGYSQQQVALPVSVMKELGVQPLVHPISDAAQGPEDDCITAVMLRPIGTLAMLRLMLHGAMGTLGEAHSVERFEFEHLVVRPTLPQGRRGMKVAFDGEVTRMRAPLDIRVLAKPLHLLMPRPQETAAGTAIDTAARADRTGA